MGPNRQPHRKKTGGGGGKSRDAKGKKGKKSGDKKDRKDSKEARSNRLKKGDRKPLALAQAIQLKERLKQNIPRLSLDKPTVSRLEHVLEKYLAAKQLLNRELGIGSDEAESEIDDLDLDLDGIDVENLEDEELARLIELNARDFDDDYSEDSEDSEDSSSSDEDSDGDDEDSDIDSDVVKDFKENMDFTGRIDEDQEQSEWEDAGGFQNESNDLEPDQIGNNDTAVSFQDLSWLKSIGFSQSRALNALKACAGRDVLESLRYLYNAALGSPSDTKGSSCVPEILALYGVDEATMHSTRDEESAVLASMFGNDFQIISENLWTLRIDASVPADFTAPAAGGRKTAAGSFARMYMLELHFEPDSAYPYTPPLIVFRQDEKDKRLAPRYLVALSVFLQDLAGKFVGQPVVFELVSWLQSAEEVRSFLRETPKAYLRLAEEDSTTTGIGASTTKTTPSTSKVSIKTSGPLPRYRELSRGVGVAVTLKRDQGSRKLTYGFVQDILTAGDHPRGIKVRMTDGQVGRVQFLSGASAVHQQRVSKQPSNTSQQKPKPPASLSPNLKKAGNTETPFITGMASGSGNTILAAVPVNETVSPPRVIKKFKSRIPDDQLDAESQKILTGFKVQQTKESYIKMKAQRESLPANALKETVLEAVRANRVVIVSGETGCGKSTQVPQFILDDAILRGQGARCKILVTQPRRISALGLADRVSAERGESSVGGSVGYHIRLEHRMSDATRILFCTTGILLRRMEDGPDGESVDGGMDDVSHVIVDEVHERSLDSDFLLMVLKDLLEVRVDLKVVLMSATLNAGLFADYFDGAPRVHIPGRTFPVHALYLEDVLAKTKYFPSGPDLTRKRGNFGTGFAKSKNEQHPGSNEKGRGKLETDKGGMKVEFQGKRGSKFYQDESDEAENDDLRFRHGGGFGNQTTALPFEQIPDEDLDASGLLKRYPKLQESGASSLLAMDTDKIQYPLIEILVASIVEKLLGGKLRTSVPGSGPSQTGNSRSGGSSGGKSGRGRGRGGGPGHKASQPPISTAGDLFHSGLDAIDGQEAPNRGILVFLPGFAEISTLHEMLQQNPTVRAGTQNGRLCLALHSTLSSEEQMRVFNRPPPGSCKVVIATNVAETSITIDDVVFVVDCGKMKQTQFDPMKGMASLEECWVSQANATQRRGRAGRVQEGTCIHLFTSHKFGTLAAQQPPEIHRTPLEQICLRIKILPFLRGSIAQVLSKVVEPPTAQAVQAAIQSLRVLSALTKEENLTPLGFHLGRLPVDVRIGKLILYGSIFGCLDPVLTIASAMSVKSPFVAPFEKRGLADKKKQEFATGLSDHLTLLTAYNAWIVSRAEGFPAERAFLYDNFLSGKTLNMIASVKRQFAELLSDIGFVAGGVRAKEMEKRGGRLSDGVADALGENIASRRGDDRELIKAVLVSALYPNVIKIERSRDGGGKLPSAQDLKLYIKGGEAVFIHPSSVNWKVGKYPSSFLVYHEKMKTSKVYIRDCSSVSAFALAFFGGRLSWDRQQKLLNLDDGWIRFAANHREAAVMEATRTAFDELLAMKIENPQLDVSATELVREIVGLVARNGNIVGGGR